MLRLGESGSGADMSYWEAASRASRSVEDVQADLTRAQQQQGELRELRALRKAEQGRREQRQALLAKYESTSFLSWRRRKKILRGLSEIEADT